MLPLFFLLHNPIGALPAMSAEAQGRTRMSLSLFFPQNELPFFCVPFFPTPGGEGRGGRHAFPPPPLEKRSLFPVGLVLEGSSKRT